MTEGYVCHLMCKDKSYLGWVSHLERHSGGEHYLPSRANEGVRSGGIDKGEGLRDRVTELCIVVCDTEKEAPRAL
jgi:hypothetical protein